MTGTELFCITPLAILFGILLLVKLAHPGPTERELKEKLLVARIRLTEERASQIKDQTQGIVERYRMTQENRVNAMLRQVKQEQEIEKLKAQIELLKRELGTRENFTPEP